MTPTGPDYLHFDLDPTPGASFAHVRETSLVVRDALAEIDIASYAKTTGSRGIHVYVPIVRGPTQKEVWSFAKALLRRTCASQSEADHRGVPRRQAPAQPRARRLQPERLEPDSGFRLFRPAKTGGYRVHSNYLAGSGTRRRNERFHYENRAAAPGQNRRLVETAARTKGPRESREIRMTLPLSKTYAPMEAQPAEDLPKGSEWHYEPKWDGFRCLAFRDGDRVDLESKSGKPLTRYFPELVEALRAFRAKQFVLDGEIVIPVGWKSIFR